MKLCDSLELESFLRKHSLKPDHALGQNFLVDEEILQKIVDAAELKDSDEVIEIGAGVGTLTRELAGRSRAVTALEFDRNIFPVLQENLKGLTNVDLQNLDVRKFTPPARDYKLVANIPYYLTSPILRQFFVETMIRPSLAVLLVQREVAEKICDPQKLSVLALEVKIFADPEIVEIVKAESFLPSPKVDSAILKIVSRQQAAVSEKDLPDFFQIMHAGFHSPRKKIRGSFASGLPQKKEVAEQILEDAGINLEKRPEDLEIEDWRKILTAYRGLVN
ncbi:MAG: 16S rRNA (adenine(1518)-N(6)/adenine(1519)-N(6))-dimethyltransferase RsmA [Patescibacteria group bacterium]